MNTKYYKEDDLLVMRLSKKPFKAAERIGSFIVHYDKNREPVLLEILHVSQLLRQTTKVLPQTVREYIFAGS